MTTVQIASRAPVVPEHEATDGHGSVEKPTTSASARPEDPQPEDANDRTTKFSAPWRQVAERKRLMLEMDLMSVDDIEAVDAKRGISSMLAVAQEAATSPVRLKKWWCGTEVERAWAHLREAEEQLFEHNPKRGMIGVDEDVLCHAKALLPASDDRLLALLVAKEDSAASAELSPDKVWARKHLQLDALRAAHAESDRRNQQARFFRNRLLLASIVCLTAAVALLVVQSRLGTHPFVALPSGSGEWNGSAWVLLGLTMLFGCIGSLITAIPAMAAVPSDFSPFNLPLQQAVLKVVFGALTAVVGVIIVNSTLIKISFGKGLSGFLLLAISFGAGQQAVTRYVDKRADEILAPT